jgi:hypothetical protein
MSEVTCPYCYEDFEVSHDDGAHCEQDGFEQEECPNCEKIMMISTSIEIYNEAHSAPCLNDGKHSWGKIHGAPTEFFVGMYRCDYCNEEESRTPEKRREAIEKRNK